MHLFAIVGEEESESGDTFSLQACECGAEQRVEVI